MASKVSVVMSVYNGECYLREAVDSILNQTFTDFEFIIIDDGSTDGTWKILNGYRDPRIRLVQNEENIGLTRSLNKGLALAEGEYVARQDADDVSLPSRFEKEVALLDEQPDVVLVSGNIDLIDSDGQVWRHCSRRAGCPRLVAWFLLFRNYLGGHSLVMFRRQPVVDLGGYSEERPYGQDYELWLRLAEVGDMHILPDVLLQWRSHDNSITSTKCLEQEAYSLMTSGQAMARLLGENLSIVEVAELRGFWLNHFPDIYQARRLNARLKQLYHAFIQSRYSRDADLERQCPIRTAISKRYFIWARLLFVRLRLFAGFKALFYMWAWRPC